MHLKVSRHLKERYQYWISPPWNVMQYFAQHYPAAVEENYPIPLPVHGRGSSCLLWDNFEQKVASTKHPKHFQWFLDQEITLAIRGVECCLHPAKKVFEHLRYFVSKNLY